MEALVDVRDDYCCRIERFLVVVAEENRQRRRVLVGHHVEGFAEGFLDVQRNQLNPIRE